MTSKIYTLTLHSTPVCTVEYNLCRIGQQDRLRLPTDSSLKVGDFLAIFDRRNSRDMILKRIRGIIPIIDKPGWSELHFKRAKSAVIRCGDGSVPVELGRIAG